jgi:hypothetical protein
MAGKGSAPRPIPNRKQFEDNYAAIFSKRTLKKCGKCGQYRESTTPGRDHEGVCPQAPLH